MQSSGAVATYSHAGKIGAMVEVACDSDSIAQSEVFQALIHDIAMQITASGPKFIRRANVPAEILQHERQKYSAQAAAIGKPTRMTKIIVDGKLNKFYEETCLYEQPFIKDPSISISTLVISTSRKLGAKLAIRRFIRFQLGDSSYTAASNSGWDCDGDDEPSRRSPKPVTPKSRSGSAAAVPNLNDD
jgi:elongation factor Ts